MVEKSNDNTPRAKERFEVMQPTTVKCHDPDDPSRTETWFPQYSEEGVRVRQHEPLVNAFHACAYSGQTSCRRCVYLESYKGR